MSAGNKRNLRYASALAPFAIIGIIVYTLIYGTKESPFMYTLSMIGNQFDNRTQFILWGIVTGSLFLFYIYYTFTLTGFKDKRALRFLVLSDVSLILCVIVPSLRETLPFFYTLHMLYAGAFVVTLLASILLFITYLSKVNRRVSKRSLLALMMVVGGSVLSLFIFGGCGIFELVFIVSLAVFLMVLNVWIRKMERDDMESPITVWHGSEVPGEQQKEHSA